MRYSFFEEVISVMSMNSPICFARVFVLLFAMLSVSVGYTRTVEVDVHGMTCAFCVDSLERKFGEIMSIYKVDVSLKQKKIRLETDNTEPSIETIKQIVLDAGFTPINVFVVSRED